MSRNSFEVFNKKIDSWQKGLDKALVTAVRSRSEILAGDARKACPVDSGDLRNSIEAFTEVGKDGISGGAVTNKEYAPFVEFGTGPTGTESGGHPLDGELGIVRKTEPWLAVIPDVGPRYVHGQPANPFMYTAMKQNDPEIIKEFGDTLKEVLGSD